MEPAKGPMQAERVVIYACRNVKGPEYQGHERLTQHALAKRIARLLESDFTGEYEEERQDGSLLYFVPDDTLDSLQLATHLGIRDEKDLFGGVVPAPFIASKCITHPLIDAEAWAPSGWTTQFAAKVGGVVLPGYSAYTHRDAHRAGEWLLRRGDVRIKRAVDRGGIGQAVARDTRELTDILEILQSQDAFPTGVVLECNLHEVATHSVGQVHIGAVSATYCGVQTQTRNNHGNLVYGGSQLHVVRGDFDTLLRQIKSPEAKTAVLQARIYHEAALLSFPGMFASRCNYDIAQGTDSNDHWHSGVLEQSWRIGGATGAEIAALQAFKDHTGLNAVSATTVEIYGHHPSIPHGVDVTCQADDARVGPLTKYTFLQDYANP